MSTEPREWDAGAYDELASPQSRWGLRILALLDLKGDETVLEAGCGTGRDTARLLDKLPRGRVIAVDGSAQMLDRLRNRLSGRLNRVDVVKVNLARPIELDTMVDVVFSVAAFHWIADHHALFKNLAAVMRPGAVLAADCGGRGNVAQVSAAIEKVSGVPAEAGIWNFADPQETHRLLEAAGFWNVDVQIHSEPASFEDDIQFERFLETVILGSHLARISEDERPAFVKAVAGLLPERQVDYVRLTMRGVR